jgi:hypothetical protein
MGTWAFPVKLIFLSSHIFSDQLPVLDTRCNEVELENYFRELRKEQGITFVRRQRQILAEFTREEMFTYLSKTDQDIIKAYNAANTKEFVFISNKLCLRHKELYCQLIYHDYSYQRGNFGNSSTYFGKQVKGAFLKRVLGSADKFL